MADTLQEGETQSSNKGAPSGPRPERDPPSQKPKEDLDELSAIVDEAVEHNDRLNAQLEVAQEALEELETFRCYTTKFRRVDSDDVQRIAREALAKIRKIADG